MTDPTTATTTSSATSTRGASPTAPRLCGGGSGDDAEVVEAWIEGLHVDPQGLVVVVDAGPGGGFASESWAADTGEALVRLVLQQFLDGVAQDVLRKVGTLWSQQHRVACRTKRSSFCRRKSTASGRQSLTS